MRLTFIAALLVLAAASNLPQKSEGAIVRAWGEPHIWAYRQPWVTTCSAPGWQSYLDNEYMSIWVHNWQKYPTSPWTVMTQVFMLLKNPADGTTMAAYYAPDTTSALPSSFTSPSATTVVTSPASPLTHTVSMYSWGSYRVIQHHVAMTTIVMGGKRGNIILSLTVGLPNVLAEITSGHLIDGCPASHVIATFPGRRRRQTDECSQYRVLMGACEYDSKELGAEFAMAAADAVTTASHRATDEQRKLVQTMEEEEEKMKEMFPFDDPLPPPEDEREDPDDGSQGEDPDNGGGIGVPQNPGLPIGGQPGFPGPLP